MLVSVIIPVYNVKLYLERAVNSILNQNLQDFEIILCDNSTDNECRELCRRLGMEQSRVKLLCLPDKIGPGAARNAGLDVACGEYVFFMDADDYVASSILSENVAIAQQYDCDIVEFGYTSLVADNQGSIVSKTEMIPQFEGLYTFERIKERLDEYLGQTSNSACTRLYKREIIGNLRFEQYTTAEDGIFNMDILLKGIKSIYFNRKSYYYYLGRPSSIMGKYNPDRYKNELELLKHITRVAESCNNSERLMAKINELHLRSFLIEYNSFTLPGCDLKLCEAAKIAKDIYNSPEIQKAAKSVPSSQIAQPSARICYILSRSGMFKTAVLFKRTYIHISYFVKKLRMKKWNLTGN